MLIGFLSSFSLLFFFGSFQDFQNSYFMPLWPGHFPVWVCFIASLTSSADVSASVQLPPHFGAFLSHVSSFFLLLFSLPYSLVAFPGVICGSLKQCLAFFWFLFHCLCNIDNTVNGLGWSGRRGAGCLNFMHSVVM